MTIERVNLQPPSEALLDIVQFISPGSDLTGLFQLGAGTLHFTTSSYTTPVLVSLYTDSETSMGISWDEGGEYQELHFSLDGVNTLALLIYLQSLFPKHRELIDKFTEGKSQFTKAELEQLAREVFEI